jgi:hypothetical protein
VIAPLVVLDRQHIGKPSRPLDLGAEREGLAEAALVRRYLATAVDVLAAGLERVELLDGKGRALLTYVPCEWWPEPT